MIELKAGRELDTFIADKFMGQTDFEHPGFYWEEGSVGDDGDGYDGFFCPRCSATEGSSEKCVKHYSRSIISALEVLEVLRKKWFVTKIVMWDHTDTVMIECEARCGHGETPKKLFSESATLPMAICLAATQSWILEKSGGL